MTNACLRTSGAACMLLTKALSLPMLMSSSTGILSRDCEGIPATSVPRDCREAALSICWIQCRHEMEMEINHLQKQTKSKSEIFLGKLFNFDVDHLHIDHILLTVKHSPVSRSLWPGWLWWTAADSSHSRCSEWEERKLERTEQPNWSGHW